MWVYLLLFVFTYGYLSLVRKTNTSALIKDALSVIGFLPMSALFALRDYSVGTDTLKYVGDYLKYTELNFSQVLSLTSREHGWGIYNWFLGEISVSPRFFLFVTSFIMLMNVYIAVRLYEKNIKVEICVLIFLFFFFNPSLNLMRQCFAISFLMISIVLFMNKSVLKSFVLLVISCSLHNSCFIGLFFFVVWFAVGRIKNEKGLKAILLFVPLVVFILPYLIRFMTSYNLIPDRYIRLYVDSLGYDFGVGRLITYIFPLFLVVMYFDRLIKYDKRNLVWIIAFVLQVIVYQMRDEKDMTYRIVLIFTLANVFLFDSIYRIQYNEYMSDDNKFARAFGWHKLIIAYCAVYWLYYFCFLGNHATVPYIFSLYNYTGVI